MSRKTGNQVLLVLACLFIATAILTLFPASAPLMNDLGYSSLCPFAPWSTLILLLAAGLCGALRNYMLSRTD
jgi:hypothetical protein